MRPVVETIDLVKRFGSTVALDGLNLRVPSGITAILGPNGAGKTTTIHILLGLLKPDQGEAYVLGLDSWRDSYDVRKKTGVLLENEVFPGRLTALEFLRFVAKAYGLPNPDQAAREALRDVGLYEVRDRRIGTFSAGMYRRLGLAKALIGEPELVILDEPAKDIDPLGRIEVFERIKELHKEKGTSFLISSHILLELEGVCEWAAFIHQGRMVAQGHVMDIARELKPSVSVIIESLGSDAELIARWLSDRLSSIEGIKVLSESKVLCRTRDYDELCRELASLVRNGEVTIRRIAPKYGLLAEVYARVLGEPLP